MNEGLGPVEIAAYVPSVDVVLAEALASHWHARRAGADRSDRTFNAESKAAGSPSGQAGRHAGMLEVATVGYFPRELSIPRRDRTSHYLIHLTQHPLGFKIMKEVMRGESSESEDVGSFGLIPDEELTRQRGLFSPNLERARTDILSELGRGTRLVRLFVDNWPSRPSDVLAPTQYKELVLALEAQQRIAIHDPLTGVEAPALRRRKTSRGHATLGERYEVRLRH